MDELNSLPYLDAVIRESLRFHSVFGGAMRVAVKDDIIPVETPYTDRYGNKRDYIAYVSSHKVGTDLTLTLATLEIAYPKAILCLFLYII